VLLGPSRVRKYLESSSGDGVTFEDGECSDEDPRWFDAVGSDEDLVSIEVWDDEEIVDGGFGPIGGVFSG
jgi:hypothetical protein